MSVPGQSTLFTTFTEMATTAYRNHATSAVDSVSKHNELFKQLTKDGRKRKEDGGLSIVCPIDFSENTTYKRYSGYDVLNTNAQEVLTASEFPWRQVAVFVQANGLEIRSNSGKNQIINLVKARITNAKRSFANGLSADFYSDGAATNQIGGLQLLVADAGTGTVGGIDSGTYSFWQNKVQSAASPLQGGGGITPGPTTMESLMLPLYLRTSRGGDKTNLIIMDETYYTFFEQSQTSLKRYAPADDGKAGMVNLMYKTAKVVWDSTGVIPSAHAYFLNTDFLELVVHSAADMEIQPELRSLNQDSVGIPILFQGNLVCSARERQGVMKA